MTHTTSTMRENAILWTGVLGPPIAWALQLQTNYALARFLCGNAWLAAAFHIVSVVALLIALGSGSYAYFSSTRSDDIAASDADPQRRYFMAIISVMAGALFALLIVAQWSARLFIDPCVY